ncbi:Dual-specificity RNA methyltransferase RlmN, partial [Haemophilus influenzae]
GQNIGVTEVN